MSNWKGRMQTLEKAWANTVIRYIKSEDAIISYGDYARHLIN